MPQASPMYSNCLTEICHTSVRLIVIAYLICHTQPPPRAPLLLRAIMLAAPGEVVQSVLRATRGLRAACAVRSPIWARRFMLSRQDFTLHGGAAWRTDDNTGTEVLYVPGSHRGFATTKRRYRRPVDFHVSLRQKEAGAPMASTGHICHLSPCDGTTTRRPSG